MKFLQYLPTHKVCAHLLLFKTLNNKFSMVEILMQLKVDTLQISQLKEISIRMVFFFIFLEKNYF